MGVETGTCVCLGRFGVPMGGGVHRVRPSVWFFFLFLLVSAWLDDSGEVVGRTRSAGAVAQAALPHTFSAQRTAAAWQPS